MAYAHVNGVDHWYDEFGEGDKYVVCASGGDFKHADLSRWPYYMADYGYHLITMTLRGHWKSTHVTEDYGKEWYNIYADDVYEAARQIIGDDRRDGSGRPESGPDKRAARPGSDVAIVLTLLRGRRDKVEVRSSGRARCKRSSVVCATVVDDNTSRNIRNRGSGCAVPGHDVGLERSVLQSDDERLLCDRVDRNAVLQKLSYV